MKKKEYVVPETETIVLVQEKEFMIVQHSRSIGSIAGEDLTIGSMVDPW